MARKKLFSHRALAHQEEDEQKLLVGRLFHILNNENKLRQSSEEAPMTEEEMHKRAIEHLKTDYKLKDLRAETVEEILTTSDPEEVDELALAYELHLEDSKTKRRHRRRGKGSTRSPDSMDKRRYRPD